MLSFIVQRSFVTINSQCRAFIAAVKKLKVSRWITTLLKKIHFIFCPWGGQSTVHIHTNVFWSSLTLLTIANLWMVWNVWSTFMALFASSALSGLWWRVWGLGGATREIWLENSHRRPHTAFRDGALLLRQDKNNHRIQRLNFCINCNVLTESWLHQFSLLRIFFSVSISFPYHRVWSEPQHDKWQVRHLHSSSPLSNLDWEYWIHVRKFEFS